MLPSAALALTLVGRYQVANPTSTDIGLPCGSICGTEAVPAEVLAGARPAVPVPGLKGRSLVTSGPLVTGAIAGGGCTAAVL